MPETAQHLLGQLVDGRFPLRKLLGTSPNSAVFLTELTPDRPSDPAPDAAIKLIPEEPESSEQQLARWQAAAALSHPGILQILHFGRCAVDGSLCLYLVTELAHENLGDLLPQRALSPDETRGMMLPVLSALAFLHENGMVHGGVKPSNILAIRDNIKLSADRIVPAGEPPCAWPLAAPYAPPESLLFSASDMWSLGVTLYETLTQYHPNRDSSGRYVLPQLASPFSEIVRGALVDDPTERIELDDVRAALDPAFIAKPKPAAAVVAETPAASSPSVNEAAEEAEPIAAKPQDDATSAETSQPPPQRAPSRLPNVDPLSVPLSPVSPNAATPPTPSPAGASRIPVSSLPHVNVTIAAPRRAAEPRVSRGSLKYFVIGAGATLVVAAMIVPRLLRDTPPTRTSTAQPGDSTRQPSQPAPASASSRAPDKKAAAPAVTQPAAPVPASPLSPAKSAGAPSAGAKNPAARPATQPPRAESGPVEGSASVEHQVLPKVSEKARSTIRGTVRINVRVALNSDGSVASAELDSAAPSQFFAKLALDAARQWKFAPSSEPSAIIHFDFTNTSTTAAMVP